MDNLIDRDQEHLRLLMLAYYIMAGYIAFFSLFGLIYVGMGAMFMSGAIPLPPTGQGDPRVMGMFFAGIGATFVVFGMGFALLTFLAGRSIRDRRRRILIYVVAGLGCIHIPWGTLLGICTFMVFARPSVKALFERPAAPPVIPLMDPPSSQVGAG